MEQKRTSGVLLHISSLPGKYGIGTMGKEARELVDKLFAMGFQCWQVLPLCPVDMSGSPYCSVSAFAGNVSLIDPLRLFEGGLITEEELKENEYSGSIYRADNSESYRARMSTLRKAFSRLSSDHKALIEIFKEQNSWVIPFSMFMAIKDLHGGKPWWEWDEKYRRYEDALKNIGSLKEEIEFYVFSQYVFFTQWRLLKEYANSKGIKILGDMPIYVSRDSVDVWSNRNNFEMGEKSLAPTEVAGVPPDYFSADGQLWATPFTRGIKWKKTATLGGSAESRPA